MLHTLCLVLAATALLGQAPAGNRGAFKIELKIRDSDDARANTARVYSFVLEDGIRGGIRVGKKVPFGDNGWADVGVNIDAHVQERSGEGALLADIDVDMSALEGAAIHQIKWHGVSRVTLSKPTVIASLQDPVLQKRLEIELTVTRMP